ncbi:MAG TPA: hypothetical protein P5253_05925, partial [bacterium]|nr:hypothetical protein [bacterium]
SPLPSPVKGEGERKILVREEEIPFITLHPSRVTAFMSPVSLDSVYITVVSYWKVHNLAVPL